MTNLEKFKKEVKMLCNEISKRSAKEFAKEEKDCPEDELVDVLSYFNHQLWGNCSNKETDYNCDNKDCEKCRWHWLNREVDDVNN